MMKNVHFSSPVVVHRQHPHQHQQRLSSPPPLFPPYHNLPDNLVHQLNEDSFNFNQDHHNQCQGDQIEKVTIKKYQVDCPISRQSVVSTSPPPPPQEAWGTLGHQPEYLNLQGGKMPVPFKLCKQTQQLPQQSHEEQSIKFNGGSGGDVNYFQPNFSLTNFDTSKIIKVNGVNNIGSLENFDDEEEDDVHLNQLEEKRHNQVSWPASNFSSSSTNPVSSSSSSKQLKLNSEKLKLVNDSANKNCKINGSGGSSASKSILNWLSFGKLKKGSRKSGGGSGNSADKQEDKQIIKRKRSSCPPLGHPLLMAGNAQGGGGDRLNFEVGGGGDQRDQGQKTEEEPSLEDDKVKVITVDKPVGKEKIKADVSSKLPPRSPSSSKSPRSPLQNPSSSQEDLFSINFERILEGIMNGDSNSITGGDPDPEAQAPPFLQQVELEEEPDTSFTQAMEHKKISSSASTTSSPSSSSQSADNLLSASEDPHPHPPPTTTSMISPTTKQKSATIPLIVQGKPPKPPMSSSSSSKNRYFGMRYPLMNPSNHHHHLLSSTSNTSNTSSSSSSSTREAMLELASKLISFREQLHSSREQLAMCHLTSLDEIHRSRVGPEQSYHTNYPAIDLQRRSLPPTRQHSHSTSPVALQHEHGQVLQYQYSSTQEENSKSAVKKNINFDQNYWNRCVASAKLNLGGSLHQISSKTLQNYIPSREEVENFKIRSLESGRIKNGDKSREGAPWKGLLLETDLDQLDGYNGTGGYQAEWKNDENFKVLPLPRDFEDKVDNFSGGGGANFNCGHDGNSDQVNCGSDLEGGSGVGNWRRFLGGRSDEHDEFGGIVKRRGGNEGDHDKLSEKERDLQLCLENLNGREKNEKNKELKLSEQLNKYKKKKVINLSLQNLSGRELSELGAGESDGESEIMATLKPGGGNGGNGGGNEEDRRRSMEFLLDTDKEKNAHLRPPENSLQKAQGTTSSGSERCLSEHELRIQRSLQKLNVPDWYKNYNPPTAPSSTQSSCANTPSKGTLPRGESPFSLTGSNTGLAGGWPGLGSSSKTSSLTSLRYSGSKTGFGASGSSTSRQKLSGGGGVGGVGGVSSLMSPSSSQASCSPSPNFERSSFTYGMPYALTRFAAARMSCGASPASLSPSPSPVGGGVYHPSQNITSSTSTPVSSGPSASRYHGYQKTPYLGWRSQERLSSKSLYRNPAERLAADLIKNKPVPVQTPVTPQQVLTPPITQVQQATPPVSQQASLQSPQGGGSGEGHQEVPSPVTTPSLVPSQVTSATASDLSLNSDESNSHKLNRVRSSIKEVSNAICDYVDELKPLDEQGMNGGRASPRRGLVWLESSFVGTKPIDSPSTPDTPSTQFMRSHSHAIVSGASGAAAGVGKGPSHSHFRFDTHELASSTTTASTTASKAGGGGGGGGDQESTSSTSHYTSYIGRNEQMEERSASSSVSSPTLEDILDSLLALRRPNKKFRSPTNSKGKGHELSQSATSPTPPTHSTKVPYDPISTSTGDDLSSTTTGSHPYTTSSTGGATYGSSNTRTFDEYLSSETPTGSPRHRHQSSSTGGATVTSAAYQSSYQYPSLSSDQPTPTTATSEIYSRGTTSSSTPSGGATGTTSSSTYYRSYQSDWQDRMNQPLPDATYLPPTTTSYSTSTPTSGGGIGGAAGDSQTTISSYTSRYSGGGGVGGGDSPISSVHSTPTHQQYNRGSPSIPPGGAAGVGGDLPKYKEKDYSYTPYSSASSCHSSPAKSILGGGGGGIGGATRDSNELVDCTPTPSRRYPTTPSNTVADEEDAELAFGNPTDIPAPIHQRGQPPPPLNTNGGGGSAPSTVAPLQGGVIINPLTGLSEYSNPPTPQRHRRVSFDLDFSDKEEKSSSRSRNKEENVGGTIQCRNTKCVKTATGLEARREFKVCHNCNAYYCSRECRRAHWEKHKKTCMQSRVGAICKQIISHVKEDSYVMNQLSTTAKRGFLAKGRGSVKLFFNSPDRAERFLTGGLPELPEPLYIPVSDMLPEEMGPQIFSELSDQCKSYNTDTRFVLYACVCVVNEVPTYGAVKWERELISRCSKLRLLLPRQFFEENQRTHHHPSNPAHHLMQASPTHQTTASSPSPSGGGDTPSQTNGSPSHQTFSKTPAPSTGGVPLYDSVPMALPQGGSGGTDNPPPPLPPPHQHRPEPQHIENESGDTLILRSVPAPSTRQLTPKEQQRHREVSFANIQKHLLLRGVDLKKTYPDIFTKLCRYVEMDEPFLPVTIYPKNQDTGKQFVCVIMPECSESNYSLANQEATIAAAVASAAAYTADYDPKKGTSTTHHHHSKGRAGLQRVETINISEAGDEDYYDDDHLDLT